MFKVHVAFSEYMNFKWSPTYSTIDFVLMVMLAVGTQTYFTLHSQIQQFTSRNVYKHVLLF